MNYFKRVPSYQELIRIKEEISEFEQFEKTLGDKIKEFKISSIKELQQTKHEIEDSVKKDLKALEKEYEELKKRYAISLGMFSVSVISTFLLRDFAHILTAASSTILAHTLIESRVFKNRLKENWVSVFFKLKHKHIL
jgi:molybdopterin converting factor small subunit